MKAVIVLSCASLMTLAVSGAVAQDTTGTNSDGPSSADTKITQQQAEANARIKALPWAAVHDTRLPGSRSTLTDMPGFIGVTGQNARTYRTIVQGNSDETIEGDAQRETDSSEIVFSWHSSGYVDAKDFSDIDADKLIDSVREATMAGNADRIRLGDKPMKAVNWIRTPTWNPELHTAYWMLEGVDEDGDHTVNAIALKLGRNGYEKMVWVTSPDQIAKSNDLTLAQDAHKYAAGDRYEDHMSGDRAAAYGIAGLVAGVVGLKAAKVLGIGALLLGFKKFLFILLVPFIWVINKVKKLFGRRSDQA